MIKTISQIKTNNQLDKMDEIEIITEEKFKKISPNNKKVTKRSPKSKKSLKSDIGELPRTENKNEISTKIKKKPSDSFNGIVVKRDIDSQITQIVDINTTDENNLVSETNCRTSDIINDKSVRRRGRNKKQKIYFSKDTEDAIISYNAESDVEKRNEIYNLRIKFSFDKLVENIYNTFKFTYFDSGPLEIQRETVAHLVSNMHKFEAGKGKAFSYFSIVAKNYLIFHNNNNYRRFNQHVDIGETPSEDSVCLQTEDVHHQNVQTREFVKLMIDYWELNIPKVFTKVKDLNIAYAVLELFRGSDRIESFNKKTLYLYIREISNCKTQQITKVLNKMKMYQSQINKNYKNFGVI